MNKCGIGESSQYKEAQDRTRHLLCNEGLNQHVMMAPPLDKPFICTTHHRFLKRSQDIEPLVLDYSSRQHWLASSLSVCVCVCACVRVCACVCVCVVCVLVLVYTGLYV